MPRKRWIDKSKATTFQVVHRPQNDPLIHDESSNSMVFRSLEPSQAHKGKSRSDLESELFESSSISDSGTYEIRDNEGEAAEHGIYFDDTAYDYMQHVRDLDSRAAGGQNVFVEATEGKNGRKRKMKISLEDALQDASLQDERSESYAPSLMGSHLGSESTSSISLQRGIEAQQDIPDTLAGFQPDMDPRLREVLEALNDDAYVDDEEEIFGEIAKDRQEVSLEEFEDTLYEDMDEDEDGWESDVTEKPRLEYNDSQRPFEPLSEADLSMLNAPLPNVPDVQMGEDASANPVDGDWMKEFSKYKQDQKTITKPNPKPKPKSHTPALDADLQSSTIITSTSTSSITSGRNKKKRKGALTSSTGFSMTSSALARTEGLTTLDRRFDKIEEEYAADDFDDGNMPDDDDASSSALTTSRSSSSSQAPQIVPPSNFNQLMDDFLDGYQVKGKRVKKGGYQTGMEQLDEVRQGLGPARVKASFV